MTYPYINHIEEAKRWLGPRWLLARPITPPSKPVSPLSTIRPTIPKAEKR